MTEMFDSSESGLAAPSRAMAKKDRTVARVERVEAIPGQSERLKALRLAYGYAEAAAFARFLDIPIQTYSRFENGGRLSLSAGLVLVRRIPGITLDYLYFGKPDGLPLDVARRLGLLDPPGKRTS
ncbi:helix-turn-helix transcriptional regulator [Bradyrhizobium sp. 188]|uniref:helix-turn-helix domain-containing protein n=1 Tax=Bradyrhizobium sp. 188 TaxID=2782656 RepID=UPI001FF8BA81|nr:helix-turn-helix transcriptional regulator [Bradyrhizobium sp. 188]MCK1501469.1 helix-turn-helix transcriptional regulator [Bradyrhizobium sp. 188]